MFEGLVYRIRSLWKKPFKIGLITPQYEGHEATNKGVAIHVYYLSRELTKLGCDVHIFALNKKNTVKKEYIGEGRLVIHGIEENTGDITDTVARRKILRFTFDSDVVKEVLKESKNGKFDIIHSHIAFAGGLISKYLNNVKWVHTVHSLEKHRVSFLTEQQKKYLELENWIESAISYADAIITVSKKLVEDILKNYKVKKNRVFNVPNGVDSNLFNNKDIKKREKRVIYIGRFSLEKGIDLIPNIAETVIKKYPKSKFTIIAPPDYKGLPESLKLTKKLENLEKKYPEKVEWVKEPLTREELAEIYRSSMILIQPSRYESFGMTVLEAMACGDAVIVSNKGGLPEVVGNAGVILPLNSKLFSKEILKLLNNQKLRERYGRIGVERVKNFEWERIAKQTLDIYKVVSKIKEDIGEKEIAVGEAMKKMGEICEN